jgi:hypothetical protein
LLLPLLLPLPLPLPVPRRHPDPERIRRGRTPVFASAFAFLVCHPVGISMSLCVCY